MPKYSITKVEKLDEHIFISIEWCRKKADGTNSKMVSDLIRVNRDTGTWNVEFDYAVARLGSLAVSLYLEIVEISKGEAFDLLYLNKKG